jgi:hypothetical protein
MLKVMVRKRARKMVVLYFIVAGSDKDGKGVGIRGGCGGC